MKRITHLLTCFIMLVFVGLSSFKKEAPQIKQQKITLRFQHAIGGEKLALETPLQNMLGEQMMIEKFKYYLSHFAVEDYKGNIRKLPVHYYLVDEADSLSKTISLTIPISSIKNLHFLLGVDSIKNVSGAQLGALDPSNGMFWTWNSGYIMAKLEGTSDVSTTQGHRFIYHIGGYKKGQNAARKIMLPISKMDKNVSEIIITADINQWFISKTSLRIASSPVCHDPGNLAVRIADNYQNMFSIKAVN